MRAVGLITEYNPFHNGHRYHVEQARRCSGAEVVVAVMSGHFVQRGEPALLDKWTRAQMALRCGVDVVVELPFAWACNSAPHFARGAVTALAAFAPHLDCLCFGSESGDLEQLRAVAQAVDRLPAASGHLRCGCTFPRHRATALALTGADELLRQPNNILALAYLRAIAELAVPLRPLTIARRGSAYHDIAPGDAAIASATAVRRLLADAASVAAYVPPVVCDLLHNAVAAGLLYDETRWLRMIQQACFTLAPGELYQIDRGMAQRMQRAAFTAASLEELTVAVKARQFTRTRIQRMLCYTVAALDARQTAAQVRQLPAYLHLLGTTARGEAFLRCCRDDMALPLVGNYSRVNAILNRRYGKSGAARHHADWQLRLDDRMTRLYTLLLPGWQGKSRQWNYYRQPYRC